MLATLRKAAATIAVVAATATAAQALDLKIMAPAAPGGGWDQTGRAMQAALVAEKIAGNVQVENVTGAGGTIGLAQFVNRSKGDGSALIVGGYVMVGAIIANKSAVTLDQVTPIARLTGEYDAIVVPASSPIQNIGELIAALKQDPGAVSWGGGSAGGTDHIAVGLIAKAAGVDPTKINYIPFSGGGEALAAILGGQVTAGISGWGEFEPHVKSGKLRVLAVTSAARLEGVDAPSLKEAGLDVEVQNWRMVAAPPGITPEQKAELVKAIEAMAKSKSWNDTLKSKGWIDTLLVGDAFDAYLKAEIEKTTAVLKDIGLAQ